ncbi:MAG: hypothetical protein IV086_08915 [Hyphomonadaceae bacterium]|nr:MAG: rhodanese domain-containing protein [Caulobacteraceae bacterium]MBT9445805.1 hypothetical protein [Hyphomonadaceae bacterium]
MTVLRTMDVQTLARRLEVGAVTLVDVRERHEHASEWIAGALSWPLSRIGQAPPALPAAGDLVFHCKSGMRTDAHGARLAAHARGNGFVLVGGIEAWKRAGMAVERGVANASASGKSGGVMSAIVRLFGSRGES